MPMGASRNTTFLHVARLISFDPLYFNLMLLVQIISPSKIWKPYSSPYSSTSTMALQLAQKIAFSPDLLESFFLKKKLGQMLARKAA